MQQIGAPLTQNGETLEAVIISRANPSNLDLYALHLLPLGTTGFTQEGGRKVHRVNPADFMDWIPKNPGPKPLDPQTVYNTFSKPFARQILSSHVLLVNFWRQMMAHEALAETGLAEEFNEGMSLQYADKKDGRITAITARVYAELTHWCEPFPAKLIAENEGISVITVRNRLQSARALGLLESPGSGKRG
jgi:hypothetical protein